MTTELDKFREDFEAWHKRKYGFVGKRVRTRTYTYYQTRTVEHRWEAWQACFAELSGQGYTKPDPDAVTFSWHIEDVKQQAAEDDVTITDEQCYEVLNRLVKYHDANVGINWEVIRFHIGEVVG